MSRLPISPEEFHRLAATVTDFTSDYLRRLPDLPAFPPGTTGQLTAELFSAPLPEQGMGAEAFDALSEVFSHSRPNSPRFFAYVFGSGEPVAAIGDFAASVLNQNLTSWRSGPSAAAIEHAVVNWLGDAVGCGGFRGSLTGGGSSANLMGLCMAREAKAPANEQGVREGGVIYCSTEAHMSVAKAAALLGLGHQAVRYIAVDGRFRMDVGELRRSVEADVSAGKKPVAIIASAGTVTTGSIDPLEAIADICAEHDIWMHVDGAYGALAAIAAPGKFSGLGRADSLSLDPHKWLYQPADCGCLLYRDPASARRAFSHSGDYVKTLAADPVEGFAFFEESIELSRRFRALKLWLSLRYHGAAAFRTAIAEDLRLAQVLADAIDRQPALERLAPVELSAVCFRYRAGGDDLNQRILKRVIQRGRVYISNAVIGGSFALRACIVNHRATEADVLAVVSEVLAAARECDASVPVS
ncbi:MAG TPA: aminotransferase class V-fold PLP-dependent enzyme [Clostridia bacterium]|nr:aminotransferase class V-fold PLP-dependent enzyme [Clostridia bacterium]